MILSLKVGHARGLKGKPHSIKNDNIRCHRSSSFHFNNGSLVSSLEKYQDCIGKRCFSQSKISFQQEKESVKDNLKEKVLEEIELEEGGGKKPQLKDEEEWKREKKEEEEAELGYLMEKVMDQPTYSQNPIISPRYSPKVNFIKSSRETIENRNPGESPELAEYKERMEEYNTQRTEFQIGLQEALEGMEVNRPSSTNESYQELIRVQTEIEDNRLKNSYIKQYHEYLEMVDQYNLKLDSLYASREVMEGLAGLKAWFHLRRDDKTKDTLQRITRREMRGLWRDTQMAIGGTTLHRISYHLTFPIIDLQKNVEMNRKRLMGSTIASKRILKTERQLMGTLVPVNVATAIATKISDDISAKYLSEYSGRNRKKAYFHRPSGRYGPGPSIYQDKISDIAENRLPEPTLMIPGSASTLTSSVVKESIVKDPVIRDVSKLAFEEVVKPKESIHPHEPKGWRSTKNSGGQSYLQRWMNWRYPWKPYRSYEEGIAEYIELDPVMKEKRDRENAERRAKYGYTPPSAIDPRETEKKVNDWVQFHVLKPYEFNEDMVTVPPPSRLYKDPGGSFTEMTTNEKKEYLLSNLTNKWLWKRWRRKRRLTKRFWPNMQRMWKRFIVGKRKPDPRGTNKRKRVRRRNRYKNRHFLRYRRLCWATIRKELDPNWRKKKFKKLLRRHYMPLFFTSMSGNFGRMWAMKAICGPSLYTRMQKMKDILIENEATSYTKYFRVKRMKIGRHVKQINGHIWIYVNCNVFVHHWIKDKYGRLMAGYPGKLTKQSWQFAFYRDEGSFDVGEHGTAAKGMWKIGAARRKKRREMRKLQPQEDREEWIKILQESGIDYDDQASEGLDVLYKNQEFLEFCHERRSSPEEETHFEKRIAEMIQNDIDLLGIDRKQMEIELDEIKKSAPNKKIEMDDKFLEKVWDIEEDSIEYREAGVMDEFLKSKEMAKKPIDSFIKIKRQVEDAELITKGHQRIWESWMEDFEKEKKESNP